MRRWIVVSAAVALLALAYAAWPFLALLQLGQAVRSGDGAAVLERVDVDAIRQSIAFQLVDEGVRGAKAGRNLGLAERTLVLGFVRSFVNGQLAAALDGEAVRRLLAAGSLPPTLVDLVRKQDPAAADAALRLPTLSANALSDLRDWRFRSPVTFDVKIGQDNDFRRWVGLRLRRVGLTWVLTEVRLPVATVETLKAIVRKRLQETGF